MCVKGSPGSTPLYASRPTLARKWVQLLVPTILLLGNRAALAVPPAAAAASAAPSEPRPGQPAVAATQPRQSAAQIGAAAATAGRPHGPKFARGPGQLGPGAGPSLLHPHNRHPMVHVAVRRPRPGWRLHSRSTQQVHAAPPSSSGRISLHIQRPRAPIPPLHPYSAARGPTPAPPGQPQHPPSNMQTALAGQKVLCKAPRQQVAGRRQLRVQAYKVSACRGR